MCKLFVMKTWFSPMFWQDGQGLTQFHCLQHSCKQVFSKYTFAGWWWISTPYLVNDTIQKQWPSNSSTVLSSNRQTVERSIRLLKGRWRKLQHLDHLNLKLIVLFIISACVLHNICLLRDDFDEGYMLDNDDDDNSVRNENNVGPQNDRLAQQKRNHLKAIVCANQIWCHLCCKSEEGGNFISNVFTLRYTLCRLYKQTSLLSLSFGLHLQEQIGQKILIIAFPSMPFSHA